VQQLFVPHPKGSIGGIGVSGGSAEQDGEVARAAVGALGR